MVQPTPPLLLQQRMRPLLPHGSARLRWRGPHTPLQQAALLLFFAAALLCAFQLHSSHTLTTQQHAVAAAVAAADAAAAAGRAAEAATTAAAATVVTTAPSPSPAPALPPTPPGPPFDVVAGVFITRATPPPLLAAFRAAAARHNANASARARVAVKFFVGKGGHPVQQSEPSGLGADVIEAPSPENMNGGKTFEWFEAAARAFPSAAFVFKCDTDTAVNWELLEPYLVAARAKSPLTYIGHMNDHESCGRFSHCPPKGCADMAGNCWVYMSGGFYGLSGALADRLARCAHARAHRAGPEDLVTGKGVKRCGEGAENVVHVRNGIAWCHSKKNTPAHIAGGTFPEGCGVWRRRRRR